ncbi:Ribose-5-phosphate isomerase B [Planctomycetes bacterium Pan216]|uniref:Ribose-5-phosphate isomerase B n=1 Tax=Kolteria novifilia TaxID=2527975 RepID=A0A518B1K6_9BACT|nr:Ribose-5-phosphate isomerase B [Planctomycetes bacterium Pan216]
MKIVMAADHAGFPLKEIAVEYLRKRGHEVIDLGTHDPQPGDDYPDFAIVACEALLRGDAPKAVVVCGSGVGVSVACNKFPGIRASICHDGYSAHQGVEHDNMNVLCLGARIIGREPALEIIHAFVNAEFTNEERHVRRLAKVHEIEQRFQKTDA